MDYIKIAFADVWRRFNYENNRFIAALTRRYRVIIDNYNPDILFYSCFGMRHKDYIAPIKIFFSGENTVPDYTECDYSIGTQRDSSNGRNLFQPPGLYCFKKTVLPEINSNMAKRKFCSFIFSQEHHGEGARLRKSFCSRLMKEYRHVDCPGKILHNISVPSLPPRFGKQEREGKIKFLQGYKFNIAFENSDTDGYITEKLVDSFMGNCVPIYWGSRGNTLPFPKDAMICANDYSDISTLIARIKEVDGNDDVYLDMLSKNPIRNNLLQDPVDVLSEFLFNIIRQLDNRTL